MNCNEYSTQNSDQSDDKSIKLLMVQGPFTFKRYRPMAKTKRKTAEDSEELFKNSPQRRAVAFIATLLMNNRDVHVRNFSSTYDWGETQTFRRMLKNINEIWKTVTGEILFYEVNADGKEATRGFNRYFRLNHSSRIDAAATNPGYIAASLAFLKPILEHSVLWKYTEQLKRDMKEGLTPQEAKRFDIIQKKFINYLRHPLKLDRYQPVLDTAIQAVVAQCALEIKAQGGSDPIILKPLTLMIGSDGIYIVGVDWNTNDISHLLTMRLDNIIQATVCLDKVFKYPEGYSPKTKSHHFFGFVSSFNIPPVCVKILVKDRSRAHDYLLTHRMSMNERFFRASNDGWQYFFDAPNEDEALTTLLSFGSDVEVLEPLSLRDRIIREISNVSKLYGISASDMSISA